MSDTEIILEELSSSGILRLTLNDNGRRNASIRSDVGKAD